MPSSGSHDLDHGIVSRDIAPINSTEEIKGPRRLDLQDLEKSGWRDPVQARSTGHTRKMFNETGHTRKMFNETGAGEDVASIVAHRAPSPASQRRQMAIKGVKKSRRRPPPVQSRSPHDPVQSRSPHDPVQSRSTSPRRRPLPVNAIGFEEIDSNGDGIIDRKEFAKAVKAKRNHSIHQSDDKSSNATLILQAANMSQSPPRVARDPIRRASPKAFDPRVADRATGRLITSLVNNTIMELEVT